MEIIEKENIAIDAKKAEAILGIYPSDMVESFERQLSEDALNTENVPGYTQHFVNLAAREKVGKPHPWVPVTGTAAKKIGDLTLCFTREEVTRKVKEKNWNKGIGKLIKENNSRREELERTYHDTDGRIKTEFKTTGPFSILDNPPEYKTRKRSYSYSK